MSAGERVRVVVVTGLSGAGKSTALRALEDLGYFCVDNLPTSLAGETVSVCERGGIRRVALGIDVRVGSFLDGAGVALEKLAGEADVAVLFVDASDEVLVRRYSETRRPHPLTARAAGDARPGLGAGAVLDGVQLERERLAPLRARATVTIDTTQLSIHDLRRAVVGALGPGKAEQPRMSTRFVSFGFKYGAPVDADLLFDVRMLKNPYFVPALQRFTGLEKDVRDYVLETDEARELVRHIVALLDFALPRYEREGRSYLTVGVGCTGGRHRSVAVAAHLAERVRASSGLPVIVVHRDLGRGDALAQAPPPGRLSSEPPPPLRSGGET